MSEKIELIPAAELPVAESDDVEALVIEGGELKRKEVGGEVRSVNGTKPDEHGNIEVSGGGYDLVINHASDEPVLVHGSFADACKKIKAGIPPMTCIYRSFYTQDGKYDISIYENVNKIALNYDGKIWIDVGDMNYYVISEDNTVERNEQ